MKVLIAGGGIAGIAAALGFARAGWEAHVFERAAALGEVGAGLQLSPNASRVLDRLGVLPALRVHAALPERVELRDGASGATVCRVALGAAAEARWGAPYLHIHRADLLDVLAGAAMREGVELHLDRPATGAVSRQASASLDLEGGDTVEGDLVIGADGIRSQLRGAIGPAPAPRYAGQAAWRGLVPAEALQPGAVGRGATVWMGDGRHLVAYPVRRGELVNFVAVLDSAAWAGEGWSLPGDPDELRAAFEGWAAPVPALLGAVSDCFLWGLFERSGQQRWVHDRIALIGDAAHPMLPFMAQGAAMAIEDGAALVRHLARADDIAAGALAWERERRPRVARVIARSRANGRLFHRPDGLSRRVVHGVMGALGRTAPGLALRQVDWLYAHDACTGA